MIVYWHKQFFSWHKLHVHVTIINIKVTQY